MANHTDYYSLLEVSKTATVEEIKKSYKKLAIKTHPDKHTEDKKEEAAIKFTAITQAYEVLTDPNKRSLYDQFGEEGIKHGSNPSFKHANNLFNTIFNNFPGLNFPFAMPFNINQSSANNATNNQSTNNQLINNMPRIVPLPLSLKKCYKGGKVTVKIDRKIKCPKCLASGSDDGKDPGTCKTCNGQGIIQRQQNHGFIVMISTGPCNSCNGSKKQPPIILCSNCNGNKLITEQAEISFDIPQGARPNEQIHIPSSGDYNENNNSTNDLIFVIKDNDANNSNIFNNHIICRDSNNPLNLCVTLQLSLAEALCGWSRDIVQLDGRKIYIAYDKPCPPNSILVMDGEGMRRNNECGKLIINILVNFPSDISNKGEVYKALEHKDWQPIKATNIILLS